jgi:hypothetical protein
MGCIDESVEQWFYVFSKGTIAKRDDISSIGI